MEPITGFPPVFDGNSRILILGSFPSVKSRAVNFYYGNRQNRFWRTLSSFFGEPLPESTEEKKSLVLRHGIALWDIVIACEITGSSDLSIRNYQVAPLEEVLSHAKIEKILLNGATAYRIFMEHYGGLSISSQKLSSTSPANPRFSEQEWREALA